MFDFHTHVWEHGPGTPPPTYDQLARYCEVAATRGITQIAVTEHSHRFTRIEADVFPHWDRARHGPLADATDHAIAVERGGDLDAYVEALVSAQDRGLPLLVGLEVDHLKGADEAMANVLSEYPFDVLLGSVHWLDAWLFDDYGTPVFASEWDRVDLDEVWATYVDEVTELLAHGHVDVLAHLDVVKVTGRQPDDPMRHFGSLIDVIAEADVAVEISSAGFHKPCEELYPSPSLLDALVTAGAAFTTASDAHTADAIGRSYDQLRTELAARSISELRTFRRRRAEEQRLDWPE